MINMINNSESICSILGNEIYIPLYQRGYDWDKDQIDDFWEDIKELFWDAKKTEYFIGIIVQYIECCENNKEKIHIIDGQQRIITLSILLNNISNEAEKIRAKNENDLDIIYKNKLKGVCTSSRKYIRDTPGELYIISESKKDYFEKIMNKPPEMTKEGAKEFNEIVKKDKSLYKLNRCDEILKKEIKIFLDCFSSISEKIDALFRLVSIIENELKVIFISTKDSEEAFEIFETLNDRGKELETSDLLKNYFMSVSKDGNIEKINTKWKCIENIIEQSSITKFIKCYWNSMESFTREKKLYKKVRGKLGNYEEIKDFIDELQKYANLYVALCRPQESKYFKNKKIQECLTNIKHLGASTYYPLVFALKRSERFDENDIYMIAKYIENFIFRNYTICGNNPNSTEKLFSDIAENISRGDTNSINENDRINSVKDIIEYIEKNVDIVNKEMFISSFNTYHTKNKDIIRYIFREFHKYMKYNDAVMKAKENNYNVDIKALGEKINDDTGDVQIEHIMPIDQTEWPGVDSYHEEYLWKIGNLTLLESHINVDISSNPYIDKVPGYMTSMIILNKEICKYAKNGIWNKDSIESRQRALAEIAACIWNEEKKFAIGDSNGD